MKRINQFFIEILKKLSPDSASRKVILLAGGTVVAQGINLLVTPVLSRLYTPSDFGVLAVYTALLSILGAFSGFSYHLAIPLPEEDRSATNLLVLSLLLNGILALLISLILVIAGTSILSFFGWDAIIRYKWFLPIGVFASGAYTIVSYFALRKEAYSVLGRTKISQKCLGALISISFGFREGPIGLILGQIVGLAGGSYSLLKASAKESLLVTRKSLLEVAVKYKSFPLFQSWGNLLNILSLQIMPLILFSYFSQEITGWFSMSLRVVQLPMVFVGQAIGQVFYQRASLSWRNGTLEETTLETVNLLSKLGTFPIISLGVVSPVLFPLLFGAEWKIAGIYSLFLSPFLWLQFLSSPISTVFLVVNRQKYVVFFQGIMLIVGIGSLVLGYFVGGIYSPIVIYSIGKMIIYFAYLLIILRIAGVKLALFVPELGREIFIASIFLAPVFLSLLFSENAFIPIFVWVIMGCGFMLFLIFKNEYSLRRNG